MFCSFTTIMEINKDFLGKLFEQAVVNPRLRQNFDLRTSTNDNSQRMLNALLPGTVVPIPQAFTKYGERFSLVR